MDKNLTEEQTDRAKAQINNLSNVRRKKGAGGGGGASIGNQLLSTALLPMGMGMMMKQPSKVKTETVEMSAKVGTPKQASSKPSSPTKKKQVAVTIDEQSASVTRIDVSPPDDPADKGEEKAVEFEIGL